MRQGHQSVECPYPQETAGDGYQQHPGQHQQAEGAGEEGAGTCQRPQESGAEAGMGPMEKSFTHTQTFIVYLDLQKVIWKSRKTITNERKNCPAAPSFCTPDMCGVVWCDGKDPGVMEKSFKACLDTELKAAPSPASERQHPRRPLQARCRVRGHQVVPSLQRASGELRFLPPPRHEHSAAL